MDRPVQPPHLYPPRISRENNKTFEQVYSKLNLFSIKYKILIYNENIINHKFLPKLNLLVFIIFELAKSFRPSLLHIIIEYFHIQWSDVHEILEKEP